MKQEDKDAIKGQIRLYGQATSYAERYTETYYHSKDPTDQTMATKWAIRAETLIADIERKIDQG